MIDVNASVTASPTVAAATNQAGSGLVAVLGPGLIAGLIAFLMILIAVFIAFPLWYDTKKAYDISQKLIEQLSNVNNLQVSQDARKEIILDIVDSSQDPKGVTGTTRRTLALTVLLVLGISVVIIMFASGDTQITGNIISMLGATLAAVVGFYFGGSQAKDFANQTSQTPQAPAPSTESVKAAPVFPIATPSINLAPAPTSGQGWHPGFTVTPAFQGGVSPFTANLDIEAGTDEKLNRIVQAEISWGDGKADMVQLSSTPNSKTRIIHEYTYSMATNPKYFSHAFYPSITLIGSTGSKWVFSGKCYVQVADPHAPPGTLVSSE